MTHPTLEEIDTKNTLATTQNPTIDTTQAQTPTEETTALQTDTPQEEREAVQKIITANQREIITHKEILVVDLHLLREETESAESAERNQLLMTASQLIRPSRTLDFKMFFVMTRQNVRDTAKLQTTENSTSGMPVPDQTKDKISLDIQIPTLAAVVSTTPGLSNARDRQLNAPVTVLRHSISLEVFPLLRAAQVAVARRRSKPLMVLDPTIMNKSNVLETLAIKTRTVATKVTVEISQRYALALSLRVAQSVTVEVANTADLAALIPIPTLTTANTAEVEAANTAMTQAAILATTATSTTTEETTPAMTEEDQQEEPPTRETLTHQECASTMTPTMLTSLSMIDFTTMSAMMIIIMIEMSVIAISKMDLGEKEKKREKKLRRR